MLDLLRRSWCLLAPLGLLLIAPRREPQPLAEPPVEQATWQDARAESDAQGVPIEGSTAPARAQHDPREWLPANESLSFKVEVTFGPVRGLDVGRVTLSALRVPGAEGPAVEAGADSHKLIGTIDTLAKGGYLGHEVVHSYAVRWYVGSQPRIEVEEKLRGSRSSSRELRIGEIDQGWKLEYRKDRHCKGCKDKAHYVDGLMPWSKPSHCKDCERIEHRVWRDYKYMDVPEDAIDIISSLYLARGFLLSDQEETTLALINQDELWSVRLRRGGTREIKTPAGTFDCMRVLIGPELAAGDGLGEEAAERFEALFGLHGDIGVWVDRAGGFPVVIEGEAPFGPFSVAVKASLVSRRGD
jgi:hypothetical protein